MKTRGHMDFDDDELSGCTPEMYNAIKSIFEVTDPKLSSNSGVVILGTGALLKEEGSPFWKDLWDQAENKPELPSVEVKGDLMVIKNDPWYLITSKYNTAFDEAMKSELKLLNDGKQTDPCAGQE